MSRRSLSLRKSHRRVGRNTDIRWAIQHAGSRTERNELIEIALRNNVEL